MITQPPAPWPWHDPVHRWLSDLERAAVSGCTGTGEESQGEVWLHSGSALAWFLFVGERYAASQYGEPEGCTATTAVLEEVGR